VAGQDEQVFDPTFTGTLIDLLKNSTREYMMALCAWYVSDPQVIVRLL
jgi:hypothetical protein